MGQFLQDEAVLLSSSTSVWTSPEEFGKSSCNMLIVALSLNFSRYLLISCGAELGSPFALGSAKFGGSRQAKSEVLHWLKTSCPTTVSRITLWTFTSKAASGEATESSSKSSPLPFFFFFFANPFLWKRSLHN